MSNERASNSMIPESERTLVIPEDVYLALEESAAECRKGADNIVSQSLITPKSMAQRILRRYLVKSGLLKEKKRGGSE